MRAVASLLAVWLALGVVSAHAAEKSSAFTWLGGKSATAPKPAKGTGLKMPTLVTKMSNGTKRLVTGTKDLITPDKPPQKTQGLVAVRKADKPKPPQQSLLGRIFNPKPTPPPSTVSEWMALDQVKPYGNAKPIR